MNLTVFYVVYAILMVPSILLVFFAYPFEMQELLLIQAMGPTAQAAIGSAGLALLVGILANLVKVLFRRLK